MSADYELARAYAAHISELTSLAYALHCEVSTDAGHFGAIVEDF